MKKLELKFGSVKEMLTKDQMQRITGGDEPFNCKQTVYVGSNTGMGCYGDACDCQDTYDTWCEGQNNCADVDCGCK